MFDLAGLFPYSFDPRYTKPAAYFSMEFAVDQPLKIYSGGLGFLAGYLIVTNINYLHHKMGEILHTQIWDPEVYSFDTIPNTMDPKEVAVILSIAVISSVLGALVPAYRAAKLNPVESLRWE